MSIDNGYVFKVLIAVDIFVCSIIWRDSDITISSMTGLELRKLAPKKWAVILGWVLNHLQKNHCEMAIESDIDRAYSALLVLQAKE